MSDDVDPETGLPVHLEMKVDADGNGPLDDTDNPPGARVVCWCGVEGCEAYK